ncbi:MAG TPA: DUF1259 domain-containing protein, partial [Chloroflexota bacterium]|nr:DUF1259 domain-containing protein [Chloroflexota bacterium]
MFAVQDILIFSALAGALASVVLWFAWHWSRVRQRFVVAGVTTFIGMAAWNFTLNITQAVPNFDVDAPIVRVSWADAGSGGPGTTMAGDEFRIGMPRTDLKVTVEGVPVQPGFALGSHAAFKQFDDGAMVMGDLV